MRDEIAPCVCVGSRGFEKYSLHRFPERVYKYVYARELVAKVNLTAQRSLEIAGRHVIIHLQKAWMATCFR